MQCDLSHHTTNPHPPVSVSLCVSLSVSVCEQVPLSNSRQVGRVVGARGSNLHRIQEATGTKLVAPPAGSGETKIALQGNPWDIELALEMVLESIQGAGASPAQGRASPVTTVAGGGGGAQRGGSSPSRKKGTKKQGGGGGNNGGGSTSKGKKGGRSGWLEHLGLHLIGLFVSRVRVCACFLGQVLHVAHEVQSQASRIRKRYCACPKVQNSKALHVHA